MEVSLSKSSLPTLDGWHLLGCAVRAHAVSSFAQESTSGTGNAYSDGFQVAEQLVSVAIGLTVGLFVSAVVTNPLGGGRRTGSGIFAF